MCKVERLVAKFKRERVMMKDHAAFPFQIVESPNVVIAGKVMHLDYHICQLAYFAEKTCVAFRHNGLILEPEVEHIAKHIDGSCLVLNLIEEANETPFLLTAVRNCKAA